MKQHWYILQTKSWRNRSQTQRIYLYIKFKNRQKPIYGDRSQDYDCLWGGGKSNDWKKKKEKKKTKGDFWVAGNILFPWVLVPKYHSEILHQTIHELFDTFISLHLTSVKIYLK